jgi:hypothetical protein
MNHITVTHPYGTTRKATVKFSFASTSTTHGPGPRSVQLATDELGEGHILVAGACDPTAKDGDTGTLTFTQGGPTGGYWKFTKLK